MNDNNVNIKKQAAMLIKLREIIMNFENESKEIKNDFILIARQNKELELMIISIREERTKLLKEIEELKMSHQSRIKLKDNKDSLDRDSL